MSKSLGTGVDPLILMEEYGADGMRFGLMLQTTGSQDIRFAEEKLLSSRNFANKIWNASRFVLMNIDDSYEPGLPSVDTVADAWILSRLANLTAVVEEGLTTFHFGETARALYDFFWSEFCDWYIELAKPRLATGGDSAVAVQRNLVFVLDQALRLLHPMMPFVTEEIWRRLPIAEENRADSLMIAAWPDAAEFAGFIDEGAEHSVAALQEIVSAIRAIRSRYNVPRKTSVNVVVKAGGADAMLVENLSEQIRSLAGVGEILIDSDAQKPGHSAATVVVGSELYVPLEGLVDFEAEKARVTKELDKTRADLGKLEKKLANEGFLSKAAPEIIEKDRNRVAELHETVITLEAQLAELA